MARFGGLTVVAAIAGVLSYIHMSNLLASYGQDRLSAAIGPLSIDGTMVVMTTAMLAIGRAESPATARSEVAVGERVAPTTATVLEAPSAAPQVERVPARTRPTYKRASGKRQTPASGNRNEEARQLYRESAANGTPLTGDELAARYGMSPRWARLRIQEAKAA